MSFIEDVAERLSSAVQVQPAPAKSLKIIVKGEGSVVATSDGAAVGDGGADTVISLSRTDFEGLASGKLNPQLAYLQGKIKIEGEPTAALQWLPLIKG